MPWANDTYGFCSLHAYFCAHKLTRARSYFVTPQIGITMGFLLQIRMSWLRALSKGCWCWCWCCGPGCWCWRRCRCCLVSADCARCGGAGCAGCEQVVGFCVAIWVYAGVQRKHQQCRNGVWAKPVLETLPVGSGCGVCHSNPASALTPPISQFRWTASNFGHYAQANAAYSTVRQELIPPSLVLTTCLTLLLLTVQQILFSKVCNYGMGNGRQFQLRRHVPVANEISIN